jgi:ribosomal protein L17
MSFIPSSIATGENGEMNVLEKQEHDVNVTSAIMTFMSYAIKSSSIYVEHSKRQVVTPDDIKRAMMIEVFMYFERSDLLMRTAEWRQIILEDLQIEEIGEEDEEETEGEANECDVEDEEEKMIEEDKKNQVKCECDICSQMNDIVEKWHYYVPKDDLGKVFKKHIDLI